MFALGTWWYFGFAIGFGGFGAVLCIWALLWDRARGRKRCPKCWYAMDAAPPENPLRCPECGHVAKTEKRLRRTRIRWKGIALSVAIMLFALSVAAYPYVRYYGIGAFVPASVLVLLFEHDDSQWVRDGIDRRLDYFFIPDDEERSVRLWQWQWRRLTHATLDRIGRPSATQPVGARRQYMAWLSLARFYVEDSQLRGRIEAALTRELEEPDDRLRGLAVMHLYDPRDPEDSLDRLLAFLEAEEGGARGSAIRSIVRTARHTPRAVEHVLYWMNHEDEDARYAAVSWLSLAVPERGRHEHLPGVYEALLAMGSDASYEVRKTRIFSLAHLQDDQKAWQTIEAAWTGDDPAARSGAFNAAVVRRDQRPEVFARMAVEALELEENKWFAFYMLTEHAEPEHLAPYAKRIEAWIEEGIEAMLEEHGEAIRPRAENMMRDLRRKLRRR